jgi:hypothetical protein
MVNQSKGTSSSSIERDKDREVNEMQLLDELKSGIKKLISEKREEKMHRYQQHRSLPKVRAPTPTESQSQVQ